MQPLRRSIPSLSALTVFEAAARLGSFTDAARELGVTQAAVSRRIKGLEESLDVLLFVRTNRSIRPTEAGRMLMDATEKSLAALESAVDAIAMLQRGAALTVGTTVAFSHFALLPALAGFRDANPALAVRVVSQDHWPEAAAAGIDVAVRYGRPPFPGRQVVASLPESVRPVCAPSFARAHGLRPGALLSPEALARLPRIGSDALEPTWLDWEDWSVARGWGARLPPPDLDFSSYSDAAYAAMAGEGILLGWTRLLHRPLADGRLIAIGDTGRDVVIPAERHHLLIASNTARSDAVLAFAHWAADHLAR